MQRTRSSTGAIRRSHMCAECGKSFRSGEDLFMHAEVCMLDAFELEASAMHAAVEEKNNQNRRSQGPDYQRRISAAISSSQDAGANAAAATNDDATPGRSGNTADKAGVNATGGTDNNEQVGRFVGEELVEEEEFEEESDYEPPPELELAEPPIKKYKRVFPIGEDGKQIRPKMECPTCGLVLYRHNFSTHFRIHTGELPFQCSFCDKRFRTSSALTVHTRCHTGERPYECPHCNYCCITKRNLDRHVVNNHMKRSARAALGRAADYYYSPRSGGLFGLSRYNYDFAEDYDDTMEDIDDENLDEAELVEEAGISKISERQQVFPRSTARYRNTDSPLGSGSARSANDAAGTSDTGKQAERVQSNYEPVYKRFAPSAKTVPILDGPKGVYGEPETETEDTTNNEKQQKEKDSPATNEKEQAPNIENDSESQSEPANQ